MIRIGCVSIPCMEPRCSGMLGPSGTHRESPVSIGIVHVTILFHEDCHLCHVVLKMAHRIQAEIPFSLTPVDITDDPVLLARYGRRVPIVFIDQAERFSGRVRERDLRRAIKWARWTRPVSRILSRLGLSPSRG